MQFIACLAKRIASPASTAEPLEPLLKVASAFVVERVYVVPRDSRGSWVSLCADRRGALYASDQYGPLYRIQLPAATGGEVEARPLKLPIGGVHGIDWVAHELFAVVGRSLFRFRLLLLPCGL